MAQDLKALIREITKEVIDEMTATGAVAGYNTPNAFGKNPKKKKDTERSMPGGKVVGDIDTDNTTVGENETMMIRRSLEESQKHEMCVNCDSPTGKAGHGDDSLYMMGDGPFCQDCYDKLVQDISDEEARHHNRKEHDQASHSGLHFTHDSGSKERMEEGRSRYRNFKESDLMRNHAKVSYGINQAKKMLGEVEYLLNICERLKTEANIPTTNLWKRTKPDMMEIHKRLKEIAKRIHRIGK